MLSARTQVQNHWPFLNELTHMHSALYTATFVLMLPQQNITTGLLLVRTQQICCQK